MLTFIVLIILYVGSLVLVFVLPDKNLLINYNEAVEVIATEGMYPNYFLQTAGSTLDNYTDQLMMGKTIASKENSALYNAFYVGGYSRYWNGYIVFLKPLLSFFNYLSIRKMSACPLLFNRL